MCFNPLEILNFLYIYIYNIWERHLDMKKLAIKYYKSNNVSQKTFANLFEINERTFRNWL